LQVPPFLAGAGGRIGAGLWPLLQQTGAMAAAWFLARLLAHEPAPVFAPIAAVVGLNADRGERGSNILRLFTGVVVGILGGDFGIVVLGMRPGAVLPVAVFSAMLLALAIDGERIVIAQAAAAAIVAVATGSRQAAPQRLTDALIGAAVALVFSQLLFPAEPLRLLHRAESAALADMASALELTARELSGRQRRLGLQARDRLGEAHAVLAEVSRIRVVSGRAARRSVWRRRIPQLEREAEMARVLGELGNSSLMLVRTADAAGARERPELSAAVRELAQTLALLAESPGDPPVRRQAAARAGSVHAALGARPSRSEDEERLAARTAARLVAGDIARFAGGEEVGGEAG